MKQVNILKVKEETLESFGSCGTVQQNHGSTCFCHDPGDYARQAQCARDAPVKDLQQFGAEEVTGDDGMTSCVMCSESFPSIKAFADVHSKTCTNIASQLFSEEQTHINYYDRTQIAKLEIDENGVTVEREDISSPKQSSAIGLSPGHNKDIIIKSEYCPQLIIDYKDEEHALWNVVKKEKHGDAANTHQPDRYGSTSTLLQVHTGSSAPPQEIIKTERGSCEYNEKKMITLQASVNPSLETRDKLIEEGRLPTVNLIHKVKTCPKKYVTEDTGNKSLAGCNRNYDYKQKSSLSQGIRKHSSEKTVAWKICDNKCSDNSSLKQHTGTHTGGEPLACKMCNYTCRTKSRLETHIRTHTGEKPFACKTCDYKFSRESSLKRHSRTHTGVKRFACDMCDHKFGEKSNLETHIRTHTGDKPFACKMCDYKSNRINSLKGHIRTHTGLKPFACKMCDHKCSEKSNLTRHIRNKHKL